ncbi:MAG: adenosylcobinamide-GDP ribazoletransferase [Candidatus Acetothermia bacterium]
MKKLFKGLRGGLAFESTLKVGADDQDFPSFVERTYLYPVVGVLLGALLGLVGVGFSYLPGFIGAALGLVGYYLVGGVIHSDGLADFADALVAGGGREERRKVMKDEKTGVAGLVGVMVVNLLLFSALVELFSAGEPVTVFLIILSGEVLSKEVMLALLYFGRSPHEGLASTFMEKVNSTDFWLGTGLMAVVLVAFRAGPAFLSLLVGVVVVLLLVWLGDRVIGGVNGDIAGAGGEIARPLGMVLLISLWHFGLLEPAWWGF